MAGLLFLQLLGKEEDVDDEGDAAADHADVGHVKDGKAHKQGLEHIGDKAQEQPVDEVTHRPGQDHRQGQDPKGVLHHFFDQGGGDDRRHHGGDDGEQPGVLGEHGKGRPGVLDIGELQNVGQEGAGTSQGDVGADQKLDDLIQNHQREDEDGIEHERLLLGDGDGAVFFFVGFQIPFETNLNLFVDRAAIFFGYHS